MTPSPTPAGPEAMEVRLTPAQLRALQLIESRLPFHGSWRDWRGVRRDVQDRLVRAGVVSTPNMNRDGSSKWEITDAGRQALAARSLQGEGK